MVSILPSNSTSFEESLESGFAFDQKLSSGVVRQLRRNPDKSVIPWLIWEYGLTEIILYIDNPDVLLQEGVLWQRERGTPAAINRALKWIGCLGSIEQEDGEHWAEIQLSFKDQLDERFLKAVSRLVQISLPARSRLARIHDSNWDIRRSVLDHSRLDSCLLSDWSGVNLDGIVHSFGKKLSASFDVPDATVEPSAHFVHASHARLQDRVLLDYGHLGDCGVLNHQAAAGAIQGYSTKRTNVMPNLQYSEFSRDAIVLSETALDDNWLEPRIWESSERMPLGASTLDDQVGGGWQFVDRYEEELSTNAAQWTYSYKSVSLSNQIRFIDHHKTVLWPKLDDDFPVMQSAGISNSRQGVSGMRFSHSWQSGWCSYWGTDTLIGSEFYDLESYSVTLPQAESSSIGQTLYQDSAKIFMDIESSRKDKGAFKVARVSRNWADAWISNWTVDTIIGDYHVSID